MSSDPPPGSSRFLSAYESSDEYCQAALKSIAQTTKSSNGLPSDNAESWNYYSSFKDFRRVMNKESSQIWELIRELLLSSSVKAPSAEPGSTQDLLDLVSEVNDHLLERIHSFLDEAEGLKSKEEIELLQVMSPLLSGSWNNRARSSEKSNPVLLTARNVLRPQLGFQAHIDNSHSSPFIPKLKEKPHGVKPLSILLETDESGEVEFYSHPYAFEISRFKLYPSLLQKDGGENPPLQGLDDVPLIWVDSLPALNAMIQDLLREKEISLDLEAHSYRSFMGITCLMQISSLSKDYLIDPFPLWAELTRLNEIFAHPRILKILHGADSDVLWLQRDFSLYLVNVFDTFRGALLLEFPKGSRSLKYLLSCYVGVAADKQYQLADWRIRPLPLEMKKYARQDTRYLIPIYRKMKRDLLTKSNGTETLLRAAHERSNDICLSRFEKPIFTEMKHLDLLKKNKQSFNSKQLFGLKEIYAWRHRIARKEDESEHYVLPNHMLLNICSELPREMQGILALCNPVPPHVKQNLVELHKMVYEARGKALTFNSPVSDDRQRPLKTYEDMANNDVMGDPLKCPLDLSVFSSQDKLETLLGSKLKTGRGGRVKKHFKQAPIVEVFGKARPPQKKTQRAPEEGGIKTPLSPFQRYKLLVPFLKSINKAEEEKCRSDDQRLNSIKKHFEELTTQEEESLSSSESPVEKKRPAQEEEDPQQSTPPPPKKKQRKAPRNFDSYDLSQLSQSPSAHPDEYNPSKQFTNKHVANNKKSNNKKKHFNKAGSRSHSYKKK